MDVLGYGLPQRGMARLTDDVNRSFYFTMGSNAVVIVRTEARCWGLATRDPKLPFPSMEGKAAPFKRSPESGHFRSV